MIRLIGRKSRIKIIKEKKSVKHSVWEMKEELSDAAHTKKVVGEHYINFITANLNKLMKWRNL